jgi:hypothetical protein
LYILIFTFFYSRACKVSAVWYPALQVPTGSVALKMNINKGLELPVPAIE